MAVSHRPPDVARNPDLGPLPKGAGQESLQGTRAAARTGIRYRDGVFNGKGAGLLDGYMEDLTTERLYQLMIAHHTKHGAAAGVVDEKGAVVVHTPGLVTRLFDKVLNCLSAGAGLIVSSNPGCLMQIGTALERAGRKLPVLHMVELLDASIRNTPAAALHKNGKTKH